jgi:hypothetical protein
MERCVIFLVKTEWACGILLHERRTAALALSTLLAGYADFATLLGDARIHFYGMVKVNVMFPVRT